MTFNLEGHIAGHRAYCLACLALTKENTVLIQPHSSHRDSNDEVTASFGLTKKFLVAIRIYPSQGSSWLQAHSTVPYLQLSMNVSTEEGYWRWLLAPGTKAGELIVPDDRSLHPLTNDKMREILLEIEHWYTLVPTSTEKVTLL